MMDDDTQEILCSMHILWDATKYSEVTFKESVISILADAC